MFTLITGLPGSGKTLFTIHSLSVIKDRPIYYYGIPDLSPDLGWFELSDPANFHSEIPDGCIIVIDEVQQFFRTRASRDPVPIALQYIETHRHKGVDIYFITQRPKFLDHHARGLAGRHIHFQRNFGLQQAVMYDFNKYTDIDDKWALKEGEKTKFKFPKNTFELYKSAEVHTHKRRLPKKLMLIPLGLLFVGSIIWWGVSGLFGKYSSNPVIADASMSFDGVAPAYSLSYWKTAFVPEIEGLPFTAPIYREVAIAKSVPMIKGCVQAADSSRCSCYSQQGTRIQMRLAQCLHFVKNPYFDFTKEPRKIEKVKAVARSSMPVIIPDENFRMSESLASSIN